MEAVSENTDNDNLSGLISALGQIADMLTIGDTREPDYQQIMAVIGQSCGARGAYLTVHNESFQTDRMGQNLPGKFFWSENGAATPVCRKVFDDFLFTEKRLTEEKPFAFFPLSAVPSSQRRIMQACGVESLAVAAIFENNTPCCCLMLEFSRAEVKPHAQCLNLLLSILRIMRVAICNHTYHSTIKQLEERYSKIIAEQAACVCRMLPDTTILFVNEECALLAGKHPEELKGVKSEIFLPPEIREEIVGKLNSITLDNPVECHEQYLFQPDGKKIWQQWFNRGIFDAGGKLLEIQSVGFNITERKLAEEALRRSEERFRIMADYTYDWEYWLGPDGTYKYISPSCERITGYTPEEFTRQLGLLITITHPEDRPKIAEHIFQMPELQEEHSTNFRIITKSGNTRWISHHCCPIFDSEHRWLGQRASNRDITERRKLEEKLRQSEKLRVVGQLAGGIAHDFNNQLAGIMGYADLLLHRCEDPTVRNFAGQIAKACNRSANLVSQLLAFAQKGKYVSVSLDVNSIIRDAGSLLAERIGDGIRIIFHLCETELIVRGDPSQLQAALVNIGLNACEAMPDGGELEFGSREVVFSETDNRPEGLTPGHYVEVRVSDTGVGMDEDTYRRVFEPFFTTKDFFSYTGMGLPAAYGTAKSHGGAIKLISRLHEGTEALIYLPCASQEQEPEPEYASTVKRSSSRTVLLVDDEEVVRATLSDLLEEMGYKVIACAGGGEAVDIYSNAFAEIDFVIVDMVMNGLDGEETIDALRRINPGLRAIISSGYGVDGKVELLLKSRNIAFIKKPYRLAGLSAVIKQLLD
jgi:PAS domain S-box-containing protein